MWSKPEYRSRKQELDCYRFKSDLRPIRVSREAEMEFTNLLFLLSAMVRIYLTGQWWRQKRESVLLRYIFQPKQELYAKKWRSELWMIALGKPKIYCGKLLFWKSSIYSALHIRRKIEPLRTYSKIPKFLLHVMCMSFRPNFTFSLSVSRSFFSPDVSGCVNHSGVFHFCFFLFTLQIRQDCSCAGRETQVQLLVLNFARPSLREHRRVSHGVRSQYQ